MALLSNVIQKISYQRFLLKDNRYRFLLSSSQTRNFTCICKNGKTQMFPVARNNNLIKRNFKHNHNETGEKVQQKSRKSLSPIDQIQGREVRGFRDLIKPFAFTVTVSGVCFAGASVWQYESLRQVVKDSMDRGHGIHRNFYGKAGQWRMKVNQWWQSMSPGQKVTAGIISANVAVFLMWRIPSLTLRMYTYFACSPFSAAPSVSMLGSMFSHYAFFHLAANMYVLWSFAPAVTTILGKEQFTAVYITAGLVSALVSHAHKIARWSLVPSLGASGAIMAILGIVCSHYPNSRLSIAFVDSIIPHSFSAGSAMKFLIAMDTLGVLLGWRFFDHAAHLGGMLFGLWYVNYGHKYIWGSREEFIRWWHRFRGPP